MRHATVLWAKLKIDGSIFSIQTSTRQTPRMTLSYIPRDINNAPRSLAEPKLVMRCNSICSERCNADKTPRTHSRNLHFHGLLWDGRYHSDEETRSKGYRRSTFTSHARVVEKKNRDTTFYALPYIDVVNDSWFEMKLSKFVFFNICI